MRAAFRPRTVVLNVGAVLDERAAVERTRQRRSSPYSTSNVRAVRRSAATSPIAGTIVRSMYPT
jgi:hypothetical protein